MQQPLTRTFLCPASHICTPHTAQQQTLKPASAPSHTCVALHRVCLGCPTVRNPRCPWWALCSKSSLDLLRRPGHPPSRSPLPALPPPSQPLHPAAQRAATRSKRQTRGLALVGARRAAAPQVTEGSRIGGEGRKPCMRLARVMWVQGQRVAGAWSGRRCRRPKCWRPRQRRRCTRRRRGARSRYATQCITIVYPCQEWANTSPAYSACHQGCKERVRAAGQGTVGAQWTEQKLCDDRHELGMWATGCRSLLSSAQRSAFGALHAAHTSAAAVLVRYKPARVCKEGAARELFQGPLQGCRRAPHETTAAALLLKPSAL